VPACCDALCLCTWCWVGRCRVPNMFLWHSGQADPAEGWGCSKV